MPVSYVNIGLHNGLSSGRRLAISCNNAGILLSRPLGTNVGEILIEISAFFIQRNAFEDVVCEMAAILYRKRWVNKV